MMVYKKRLIDHLTWIPLSDNSNIPIPLFKYIHAYKVFTLY